MFKSLKVAAFLAFKAITRGNLGITLMTIFMLMLVAMNLLFVPGLINGAIDSSNRILIKTYSADIIVEPEGEDQFITNVDSLMKAIESMDGVAAVTARNTINAKITFEGKQTTCTIVGIDPKRDEEVFEISQNIIEGTYLSPRDRNEILLGVQVAGADIKGLELYSSSLQHVHAGDKVVVSYANGPEKQYTVKGIFQVRFIQTDLQAFITDLEFQSIIPASRNRASSIRIKLEPDTNPQPVIDRIDNLRGNLEFKTWEETAGLMKSMTDSFFLINQILSVVNFLVAGITVFIVTYVDVVNRKRQIGIQRAIGIKPQSITLSYLIRALFYALTGLALAIIVFKYVIIPLEMRHPFTFPFGAAYLTTKFTVTARMSVTLLIVALIAAYIPVYRTMRTRILEAIWG
ncbi:MAG: ABC transporter permease [Chloroflexi bacterium]|nr:ABC transporter permease [Chloroflexota bacterium]